MLHHEFGGQGTSVNKKRVRRGLHMHPSPRSSVHMHCRLLGLPSIHYPVLRVTAHGDCTSRFYLSFSNPMVSNATRVVAGTNFIASTYGFYVLRANLG